MSIFKFLTERLWNEEDGAPDEELDLGGDEEAPTPDEELPPPEEEPALEDGEGDTENAKALVDALVKYAPGKEKEIKNMLKYAANSDPEYDVFNSAYDYFESIEDDLSGDQEAPEEELPPEDAPEEALSSAPPAKKTNRDLDLSGI